MGDEMREAAKEVVALLTTSGREPPPLNDGGLLSILHFYAGPNARTAVDPEKARRVAVLSDATRRLAAALSGDSRANGEPGPGGETGEWSEFDAINVLALPLHRWSNLRQYRRPDGNFDGAARRLVYSNGTEHGFAQENAETVLDVGPMLRRVLLAGVKACMADPDSELDAYVGALAAGAHDEILAIEGRALREADPSMSPRAMR